MSDTPSAERPTITEVFRHQNVEAARAPPPYRGWNHRLGQYRAADPYYRRRGGLRGKRSNVIFRA